MLKTVHNLLSRRSMVPSLPWSRRWFFFTLVIATTWMGINMMFNILRVDGITPIEGGILALFVITFIWIAVAFWTAVIGFVIQLLGLDPLSLRRRRHLEINRSDGPIVTRTAVVMPIHNEEVDQVIARLEATYRDLQATGWGAAFDFYLLSDTTDAKIATAEEKAWVDLVGRVRGRSRLFYRRRRDNRGRKAGNIAEFCRRWGAYYDYMIVLDADSVMSGNTLVKLVCEMQANPKAGIIQTSPIPVRQQTLFGRMLQFASALYNPMWATGISFWQRETSNYWGHNAIIRVKAFMDNCGLPDLPGSPPLGGEILSHDFVEAALIRRAGWQVLLLPELSGSYEEVPTNLIDYAKRDRRWAQGNIQHLRLIFSHGLHPLNRLYFLMGALAYLISFLWLLMLILGTVDAVGRAITTHEFFSSGYQLFPHWPIAKTNEIILLLMVVVGMLVLPKGLGVLLGLLKREKRRAFGGSISLILSAVGELVISVMIAPVMMIFQAYFVVCILGGHAVNWGPQNRDGRGVSWSDVVRSTWIITIIGLAWGAFTWWITPIFFWGLTPVLFGLVFAPLLIWFTGQDKLGMVLRRWRIFLVPVETKPPQVLRAAMLPFSAASRQSRVYNPSSVMRLLPDKPQMMPIQSLDVGFLSLKRKKTIQPSKVGFNCKF